MGLKFVNNIPCIEANGEWRKLASLKPSAEALEGVKRYGDHVGVVDPSTWAECDYSFYKSPIRNQQQHGSCTNFAGVAGLDITRRMAGQTPVLLSGTFAYAQVNGGRDNGAAVTDVLKVFQQLGDCTDAECGVNQIFKNQIPVTAYTTAKQYMVEEAILCQNFEEICDAVNRGFATVFGIKVGQNFSRLSPAGVAPLPDMVVGGHALCGMGLKKSPTNTWLLKTQNSWGAGFGLGGYLYLTKGHFDQMVDAYAIMYSENLNPAPPAKVEAPVKVETPVKIYSKPVPRPIDTTTNVTSALEDIQTVIKPVSDDESLTAQLEGNASMVHNDPDALVPELVKKEKKEKHQKQRKD